MKVLMFGWEFPPNISGGLGTACYGLVKCLSKLEDMDVTFVVPKVFGDEDKNIKLIGAENIPVACNKVSFSKYGNPVEYFEVNSKIVPYISTEEFSKPISLTVTNTQSLIEADIQNKIIFTGKYGPGLLSEVQGYSKVASVIAMNNEFDIIHAHDWLTYPAGIAAKQVSGKPLVIHVHATDFDRGGGSIDPKIYAIEKLGMDSADKIITVSNFTRRMVIDKYAIDPEKVITVHNGVEPFRCIKNIPVKSLKEKVVTFLGRITTQKGPEYFLETASLVLQKMNNVRFVMAGSGNLMNQMILRSAQLKISNRFHFTDFLNGDDVSRMLRMSDVYVMPSISEPFGISPLEAMQVSVPVIISCQSGVSEILSSVIKVNYWDIDAMADAIYGILSYPGLSKMMSELGRKESCNIKWEDAAQKVSQVYKEIILKIPVALN